MANPQDELEGLKAQVAALTARIYMLEQRLGVAAQPPPRPAAAEPTISTTTEPQRVIPRTAAPAQPAAPSFAGLPSLRSVDANQDTSLEKKIGQYWLNRIGIAAVLFGVAFFLKWAFDNNLIGPGGRVAIGMVVGIGLILWS